MTRSLAEIIEKAYRLFSPYSATAPLNICTKCCMDPEMEKQLASSEVRIIPPTLLERYTNGGKSFETPVAELKHFFPRYLDLIASFEIPSHSIEITLQYYASIQSTWTSAEHKLIEMFKKAFFETTLKQYPLPGNEALVSILVMYSNAGWETEQLLDDWLKSKNDQAVFHFKDLFLHGFKPKKPLLLSNGFALPALGQELRKWVNQTLVKDHFKKRIESILLSDESLDQLIAADLSLVYDKLAM